MLLENLDALDIPVPPMLLWAVGYPEERTARFVGLCWIPWGDESYYLDGRLEGTGNPWAYLEYFNHRHVARATQQYNLGSSEFEATHIFVIDREPDPIQAYIGKQDEVREFLAAQWGDPVVAEENPVEISSEDLQNIVELFREMPPPSEEQIRAAHLEQSEQFKELKYWIEQNL
jgi:hypothetical protein